MWVFTYELAGRHGGKFSTSKNKEYKNPIPQLKVDRYLDSRDSTNVPAVDGTSKTLEFLVCNMGLIDFSSRKF